MRIIVLFNLKPDADPDAYEAWAKRTDLPTVNGLPSVGGFTLHRATGLLGTEDAPPYRYVEVLDVADPARLGEDVSTETMSRVAAEFRQFADNPIFIVTEQVGP